MKRILLFPASVAQREAFVAAKEMGLYIVTVDKNPEAPCFALADESHCLDPGDENELMEFVRGYHAGKPLAGTLLVGCDIPVSMAKVAKFLGTPSISIQAARLTVDKFEMKQVLRDKGLPVPDFFRVDSGREVARLLSRYQSRMVIKPNDNSGARGVLQLQPGADCHSAFKYAEQHATRGGVILEKFESGPQVSIEGLVCRGELYVTGFADRNYEYLERFYPHIIENGATIPSELSPEKRAQVEQTFAAGVRALAIDNSVVKGDMVCTDEGVKIIEIAGRMSGGKFASLLVPKATGVDLISAALSLAVGETPGPADFKPRFSRAAAVRYFFPTPGRLTDLQGIATAKQHPGIVELFVTRKPGDILPEISNHAHRSGWALSQAATRLEAVKIAESAVSSVRCLTDGVTIYPKHRLQTA